VFIYLLLPFLPLSQCISLLLFPFFSVRLLQSLPVRLFPFVTYISLKSTPDPAPVQRRAIACSSATSVLGSSIEITGFKLKEIDSSYVPRSPKFPMWD
jgi:hypothetical protein